MMKDRQLQKTRTDILLTQFGSSRFRLTNKKADLST